MMNVSLILIGTELLNGKIQDKNAYQAARTFFNENFHLSHTLIIPDDETEFKQAMATAMSSSQVVLLSGGLGPTGDDLTMDFLAGFFRKKIAESEAAIEVAQAHYARAKREFNHTHSKYRLLPEDFTPLINPTGLAPGLSYVHQGKLICALPGVPKEFETMLSEVVLPLIKKTFNLHQTFSKNVVVKTRGIPEEAIFKKVALHLWDDLSKIGSVSSLPHYLGVDIGVFVQGKDSNEIAQKEKKVLEIIQATAVKEHIWHIGPEDLETVIVSEARAKGIKFAFAESCTGGLNSHRITNVSGASAVYFGSITSYDNSIKTSLLKVREETLKNFGAVSNECALEMSQGAQMALGVDIAIATTGICGPGGGSEKKPVGTIAISYSDTENKSEIYNYFGDRETLKWRFSQMAFYTLLDRIRAWKNSSP